MSDRAKREMYYYDLLPAKLQNLLREMDLPIDSPSVYEMCRVYGTDGTFDMIVQEERRIKHELSKQSLAA